MTPDSLLNQDWERVVGRLGGTKALDESARATKAFQRPRAIKCATDMLRLVLAYCLGDAGLRSVAAWAAAIGLADISNVALLNRLRQSGAWLSLLIGHVLAGVTPNPPMGGRSGLSTQPMSPRPAPPPDARTPSGVFTASSNLPWSALGVSNAPMRPAASAWTGSR
jgi:hypothetical protein